MIGDLLARRSIGSAEVDLICSLNRDHELDQERYRLLAIAITGRQGNARCGSGMPGERRGPRPRSAGADQSRRRRSSNRRGLSGAPADHRRQRASRCCERDHAHDGIGRAGSRARHSGAPSPERSRRAWTSWHACFPLPSPLMCSGPSPRYSFAPTINRCPSLKLVRVIESITPEIDRAATTSSTFSFAASRHR